MQLLRLVSRNFRNLDIREFQPDRGTNLIVGANAQGKTSLLEAIHFCSYMKSFRTSNTRDLIRDGNDMAFLSTEFTRQGINTMIQVTVREGMRSVLIDGNKSGGLKDVIGQLKAVSLTPEQVAIFDGPPALRRSFVDSTAVMIYPDYATTLGEYQKAIKNRNVLLKEGGNEALFMVLEQAVSEVASRIAQMRQWAASTLSKAMLDTTNAILDSKNTAKITYLPSGTRKFNTEDYIKLFARTRERDLVAGYSTKGPHADDFRIELHGHTARARASRGQRKALLVAVKLAQARIISNHTRTLPILLLDDIFGDLDKNMTARVWDALSEWPGQSIITSVNPLSSIQSRTFTMKNGQIEG